MTPDAPRKDGLPEETVGASERYEPEGDASEARDELANEASEGSYCKM
jgi:hypothetical protein